MFLKTLRARPREMLQSFQPLATLGVRRWSELIGSKFDIQQTSIQTNPLVTKSSATAVSVVGVRGVMADLYQCYIQQNLHHTTPSHHKCVYFTASYFPPDHFLCSMRKSKPAYFFRYADGYDGNNSQLVIKGSGKSINPFNYAVHRVKCRRAVRNAMWESFNKIDGAKDGLYSFQILKYPLPEDMSLLQKDVDTLFSRVSRLRDQDFGWVQKQNSKLQMSNINKIVRSKGLQPIVFPSNFGKLNHYQSPKSTQAPRNTSKKTAHRGASKLDLGSIQFSQK